MKIQEIIHKIKGESLSAEEFNAIINNLTDNSFNFIVAGQSNAVSRNAPGANGTPEDLPTDGIIPFAEYWDGNKFSPFTLGMNIQGDNVGGYGIEYRIAKTFTDKGSTVKLLKYAYGGSRIGSNGTWSHGQDGAAMGSLTNGLITNIKASGIRYDALIWIQGENDSTVAYGKAYEDNLTKLIDTIRKESGQPNLMFVVVKLAEFPSLNKPQWEGRHDVKRAQENICKNVHNTRLVHPPLDSTFRGDRIHYNPGGLDGMAKEVLYVLR